MNALRIALCPLLLVSASLAHATQPVGKLVCPNINFNVSYFNFGITGPAAGSRSGGEAGKTTLGLVVHAALSSFDGLVQEALNGAHIPSCTLTTQASNGDSVQFTLQNVYVDTVNAIASSATSQTPQYAYIAASFSYGKIGISESNGADDGGASPASDKSQLQER